MGGSLSSFCINLGSQARVDDIAKLSLAKAPSLPKRTSFSARELNPLHSLQETCVRVAATAICSTGAIQPAALDLLNPDLHQRVLDHIISMDKLSVELLQQLVSPYLHHLYLEGHPGVDDTWLPVVARAQHLRALDLSACSLLTDAGLVWLCLLGQLTELRLQHCSGLSDTGLALVSRLGGLRELNLEACDGLTSAALAAVGHLTALTSLNISVCPGILGGGLHHITGLCGLVNLQLGWCRDLGDIGELTPDNTIHALAHLTRLTQLNLHCTKAGDGQLMAVLPHLKQLQVLDLSGSSVSDLGLPAVRALAHCLRVLKLSRCQVSDTSGPVLAQLSKLQELDLSCTALSNSGLLALGPLTGLQALVLDMCRVGDEGCRVFRRLTGLQRLDLSDTDVGDGGMLHLARCRRLAWLSLCNTEVGDCCATSLADLTCLTHLNLDTRCVSEASVRLLLPLGCCLRELDLYGAKIKTRGAALLAAGYSNLESLELCGGHISDTACMELSKLRQLRHLNLSQNRRLTDMGLRTLALGLADRLEEINLSYTSVSDACISSLAGMRALQMVVLTATAVTAAGVARLERLRPKLLVKVVTRTSSGC